MKEPQRHGGHKERANEISQQIIEAALAVHRDLGPGLLESAYETCLQYELREVGLGVESQVAHPVIYKGLDLECGYRLDLLVENLVVEELKAVKASLPIHETHCPPIYD